MEHIAVDLKFPIYFLSLIKTREICINVLPLNTFYYILLKFLDAY